MNTLEHLGKEQGPLQPTPALRQEHIACDSILLVVIELLCEQQDSQSRSL